MTNRDIKEIFAENLKRYRGNNNETVTTLAEAIGVAQSTISDWENAKKMPRSGAIEKISEHFGINKSDLLVETMRTSGNTFKIAEKRIPLFGDIAAGALATVEGVTEVAEHITIPVQMLGKHKESKDLFAMQVNGNSMNRIIPDGSYIIAKPINSLDIKDDDIVIFSHDSSYSMKRFRKDEEDKVLVFSPESKERKFRDIVVPFDTVNDLIIYAKVIWYSVNLD